MGLGGGRQQHVPLAPYAELVCRLTSLEFTSWKFLACRQGPSLPAKPRCRHPLARRRCGSYGSYGELELLVELQPYGSRGGICDHQVGMSEGPS